VEPILVDTSAVIRALREGDFRASMRQWAPHAPLWLSAVVLEELYAGARGKDRLVVAGLERDFDRADRLLVPSLDDWRQTGQVLADVAEKHGYEQIGRGRLTNDALIAMGAARKGLVVLTANWRDFELLSRFCSVRWQALKPASESRP
jgi:predicted nucleic acid-binding protein